MIVLLINYISVFYIKLCVNDGSHIKYTYMIDQKYSHIVTPNHASLSHVSI